jgi:hypothetical protein
MVISNIVNTDVSCEPPVCPDNIAVRILNLECTDTQVIISWVIDGTSLNPLQNNFLWSVNNQNFSNSQVSSSNSSPFFATFPLPAFSGLLFVKVKVLVGITFYESDIKTLNLNECGGESDFIVPSSTCTIGADSGSLSGVIFSDVWVKEEGIPIVPDGENGIKRVHFKYGDSCLFIDDDNFNSKIPIEDAIGKIVLDGVTFEFGSCGECFDPPPDMCTFQEDVVSGTTNFSKTYNVTGAECIEIIYSFLTVPVRIIITNSGTAEILFDTACVFALASIARIDVISIDNIKVTLDADCNGISKFSTWEYTLKCSLVTCP